MKRIKYDNKGLSLIELLVAITISILIVGVVLLLTGTSIFQYKNINVDTNLQNEAQITSNQVRDLLMEANRGVSWSEDTDDNVLSFYYVENEKQMVGVINYTKNTNELKYKLYEYGDDPNDSKEYLLSSIVNKFTCDVSEVDEGELLTYNIRYFIDDEEWSDNNKFSFRNTVELVDSAEAIFGE